MDGGLRAEALVGGERGGGAAEESTKVLVKVGEELAVGGVSWLSAGFDCGLWTLGGKTYYCMDEVPAEGLFIKRGAAPPSSRKLIETPLSPPRLDEFKPPLK